MLKFKYSITFIAWLCIVSFLCIHEMNGSNLPKIPMMDKVVHFVFHFIITGLLFLSLKKEFKINKFKILVATSFCFSLFYGVTIEWIQDAFTIRRHADVFDVLANSLGSLVVLFYFYKLAY